MEWRILTAGEVIEAGDEVDECSNPWPDEADWQPVRPESIGQPSPDPAVPAHSIFRRRCQPPTIVAPWDARAAELELTRGDYARYEAWEEWWREKTKETQVIDWRFLFGVFCKAIEESRIEVPHA